MHDFTADMPNLNIASLWKPTWAWGLNFTQPVPKDKRRSLVSSAASVFPISVCRRRCDLASKQVRLCPSSVSPPPFCPPPSSRPQNAAAALSALMPSPPVMKSRWKSLLPFQSLCDKDKPPQDQPMIIVSVTYAAGEVQNYR